MALIQQFDGSQNQAGTILYFTDATGDYNVATNPGGYGTPNTERTDLALYATVTYKAIAGDVDMDIDSYDPESVTTWTIQGIEDDGNYELKVYPVPRSGTEGGPTLGMFRHDFATNLLEYYNGSSWATSSLAALVAADYTHVTTNFPILVDLYLALNNLNKLAVSGCQSESRTDIYKMIQDTQTMIYGTIALFAEGAFAQAQKNIEKYQSRVDYILTLS